jgi:signal transduction histidine kinase
MRFGVSAKVILAYAVLLLAFAATSLFSLRYLHGARQEVLANLYLLDVQSALDASWRHLSRIEQEGKPALAGNHFVNARERLRGARGMIEEFLTREPRFPQRADFEKYLQEIAKLDALTTGTQSALAFFDERKEPASKFPPVERLKDEIDVFRKRLHDDRRRVVDEISQKEERAVSGVLALGLTGLLVAIGTVFFMWRTLRPLQILRMHAQQIAGGDYGRRIGVRSRDEIGDLAREFDAMAQALEEREQRLIRSERLAGVGKIAAQITHEIRNPLASIGLYAELLGDELPDELKEARRLLTSISGEVDRLSEITESYLRFVRLPKPKLEPEDPGALVTAVMEFSRAELSHAGIALELEVAPGLPEVAADENQIRQALLNLVRNAKEAMSSGGRLRVAVAPAGPGRVSITVADSGAGIPAEHVDKIFDAFFSTKEKGTGLGLALVQQIVAEHGGRIEVSHPPQGGTAFVLTLNALPRPANPPPAREEAGGESPVRPPALAIPSEGRR